MLSQKDPISIAIVGPTASGKSDIAIKLAKKFNGEIISADSRQIYRGVDIGSGKEPGTLVSNPDAFSIIKTVYLSKGISHYMIDIVHPNTLYNVAKYVKNAQRIREDIWKRGKIPIICGGTGFWAQALIEGLSLPSVPPNRELRKKLENHSTEFLYEKLSQLDKDRALTIEPNNRVHMIRSIEICNQLGKVPTLEKKIQKDNTLVIAIDISKELLHAKIEKRFEGWMKEGLLDEILSLHTKNKMSWKRLENFGLEYKWGSLYLRNKITDKELREFTVRDIKKYAKRQLTWLRRWEKQGKEMTWESDPKIISTFVLNSLEDLH